MVAKDFLIEAARGALPTFSLIQKFGRNTGVTTALTPICDGGNYQTPTSAQALEIVSSSVNDTSAGSGARTVIVQGLDENGAEQQEEVTLNGTTAVDLANSYLRVFRMWVNTSGTYATQAAPSQAGTITLRADGGGATWATIPEIDTGFGAGQTLIGAYTIPAGKIGYVTGKSVTVDSNKTADLFLFKRENILDVSAPYSGTMRILSHYVGVTGHNVFDDNHLIKLPALTDIGFLGRMSTGTGDISVTFDLLISDD